MPRIVTPTIADDATHRLFPAVHLAAQRRANTYKDFLKLIIESMSRKGLPFSTSRKFACTARAYRRA